ncbi:ribulose-5-phosphate 4-epimerase/fuculose-1-phosphate aldolase [Paraburkholderia caballeronis]|uniref:3-oxo-tetronate 4-phosphate decarboxylase n=1 Tax=Paraburkholderia caballeronis TaxID=416943 RepID=UPI00106473F8|nr:aldolase [Paraburkholderia caballeronis]TDV33862.1 ribulose-5-phosphate 4-epimerase/fuculose-1-phosphate aldolase [Paraburkholderia caballeronis]
MSAHSTREESTLREEMTRIGKSLFDRGYTVGTAGNISVRLDDGWLITPTDACLGDLDPARIAKVNTAGEWLAGDAPSKTLALHRAVYDRQPDIHAVVHTHSTHLVALTLAGVWHRDDVVPPLTPYHVMKVGHIPLLAYHRPGDPAVAAQVRELASSVRGVLLDRLGPVVWHRSLREASATLEELEETARLFLMARLQGATPEPLNAGQITELCTQFGVRW